MTQNPRNTPQIENEQSGALMVVECGSTDEHCKAEAEHAQPYPPALSFRDKILLVAV
jgi:hypothetical protein